MKQIPNILTPGELKELRKAHKISQGTMCEIMGMSRKSYMIIRRYEKGERDITNYRCWEKLNEYLRENKLVNED